MRTRIVAPNYHTYNTSLTAYLDGLLAGTVLGTQNSAEMLADAKM